MSEVLFYHMTQTRLEQTLPGLLERSLERGWRVVVQTTSNERRDALDAHLWTYRDESFLPHAAQGGSDAPDQQPIWITCEDDNPNGAHVRFLVDGAVHDDLASYTRAIYMFDGHDEQAVQGARARWKAEKEAGHDITYWQQDDEGRWQKKA
ncbi:DNA polymerase III subunit chi [Pseudahrensia aquimaris]|uniref:DNA polymerase III subunit chi n=1 Tax=Pseudahrensia aquimaris TaxID=744461 RepID=A0ABW3FCS2_9HYPH